MYTATRSLGLCSFCLVGSVVRINVFNAPTTGTKIISFNILRFYPNSKNRNSIAHLPSTRDDDLHACRSGISSTDSPSVFLTSHFSETYQYIASCNIQTQRTDDRPPHIPVLGCLLLNSGRIICFEWLFYPNHWRITNNVNCAFYPLSKSTLPILVVFKLPWIHEGYLKYCELACIHFRRQSILNWTQILVHLHRISITLFGIRYMNPSARRTQLLYRFVVKNVIELTQFIILFRYHFHFVHFHKLQPVQWIK